MSFRHLWAITRKEIQHIFRDRTTFFLVMLTPAFLLFVMAYALAIRIKEIPIAILDYDRSAISRAFIHKITAGDDIHLYAQVNSLTEIDEMLMRGDIKAAVIIAPEFSQDLLSFKGTPLQIIIDGTEPEGGGFALDHIGLRTEEFVNDFLATQIQQRGWSTQSIQPIDMRIRTLFNPGLKSEVSIIPGLISMMMGLPAMSVALTLAREREHGTLEQLIATPISRLELLLGKMLPYILIAISDVILLPLIGILWFDVPINGDFALFFGLSLLFLFAVLSMGLIIGVFIRTQPGALAMSFLVVLFPGFFLTGIFFPIVSMPEAARLESLFLPGTHYAIITRGIFLSGVGLDVLWPYGVFMVFLGLIFIAVAALFFRKKLG